MASRPTVLLAPNPSPMTLDGTRTYLVGSRNPVIIDPGPDDPRHRGSILDALAGRSPAAIILTHSHLDHSGGAAELARTTGADMYLHPLGIERLRLTTDGLIPIRDGTVIEMDQGEIRLFTAPGHAPDHLLALHVTEAGERMAFVGDLLMGHGDTTLVALPEGNLADYLESLDKLTALNPDLLFPGHGPPLEDPPGAIARFRKHRYDRMAQVRQLMEHEPDTSLEQLVTKVYGSELDPSLRRAAAGSLEAVLQYLEASTSRNL